jgi:hypothetical protein
MSEIKYIYIHINILNGPKKQQNALLLISAFTDVSSEKDSL